MSPCPSRWVYRVATEPKAATNSRKPNARVNSMADGLRSRSKVRAIARAGTARPGEMELVGEGAAYDGSVLCAGSQAQAQAAGVSQISLSPMGVASGGSWALLGAAGGSCNRRGCCRGGAVEQPGGEEGENAGRGEPTQTPARYSRLVGCGLGCWDGCWGARWGGCMRAKVAGRECTQRQLWRARNSLGLPIPSRRKLCCQSASGQGRACPGRVKVFCQSHSSH